MTQTPAPTAARAVMSDDIAKLLLRIVLGGALFAHGWQKFFSMGVDQVGLFFSSLGLPMPEVAAIIVAVLELVGGALLVLGVFVRPLAVLAALELFVAIVTAHAGAGFYADGGGWELPAIIAAALVALALLGPGRFSALATLHGRIPAFLR